MNCTSITIPSPYCTFTKLSKRKIGNTNLKLGIKNNVIYSLGSMKCIHNQVPDSNSSKKIHRRIPSEIVADKLKRLVDEFKSLNEPIDRVKRLLHYAMILAPMDESGRVSENKVSGCATQVWLEVEIDECGKMRFKADSDSEISKGFCSCLIWILDGAEPIDVLAVKMEDLDDINLGLQGKMRSRVNTWQNVLICMQKRTSMLVRNKEHHGFIS